MPLDPSLALPFAYDDGLPDLGIDHQTINYSDTEESDGINEELQLLEIQENDDGKPDTSAIFLFLICNALIQNLIQ